MQGYKKVTVFFRLAVQVHDRLPKSLLYRPIIGYDILSRWDFLINTLFKLLSAYCLGTSIKKR